MHISDTVQRIEIEGHDVRIRIDFGLRHRHRPELIDVRIHLRNQVVVIVVALGFRSLKHQVDVGREDRFRLGTFGFRQKVGTRVGGADRDRLLPHQRFTRIVAVGNDAKGKSEHECEQREDRSGYSPDRRFFDSIGAIPGGCPDAKTDLDRNHDQQSGSKESKPEGMIAESQLTKLSRNANAVKLDRNVVIRLNNFPRIHADPCGVSYQNC